MRIAGGVLLLIIGLFALIDGGCIAIGSYTVKAMGGSALTEMAGALKAGTATPDEAKKAGEAALANLQKKGDDLVGKAGTWSIISIVIRIAGLLCLVAGILFLVNKAKVFGMIAPAVGIVAEILLFVTMAFNVVGLIRILVYAFGAFAATKIGEQKA